jgi:hypothetical protein
VERKNEDIEQPNLKPTYVEELWALWINIELSVLAISISILDWARNFFLAMLFSPPLGPFLDPPLGGSNMVRYGSCHTSILVGIPIATNHNTASCQTSDAILFIDRWSNAKDN